jgi:hypothetical protein
MAVVDFNQINFTTKFEDLDVGTYFKFEGELFVKLRIAKEEDDAYGDEGEEVNALVLQQMKPHFLKIMIK